MYKQDLVLNNLQGLICHKIQLNIYLLLKIYILKVSKFHNSCLGGYIQKRGLY